MTATLSLTPSSSYQVSENLRSEPLPDFIFRSQPGESDREELLLRVLGPRGWGRIHQFRNYYETGWGDGKGRSLSPRALEAFYQFLTEIQLSPANVPSVFLTGDGGLELVWGEKGSSTQVEFTANKIEFLQEFKGVEEEIPLHQARQLAKQLCVI